VNKLAVRLLGHEVGTSLFGAIDDRMRISPLGRRLDAIAIGSDGVEDRGSVLSVTTNLPCDASPDILFAITAM